MHARERSGGREGELAFLVTPDGPDDLVALVQEQVNNVDGDETRGTGDENLRGREERKREKGGREGK